MQTGKLLKIHKMLSMTALILSLIWILSGFMHPIMGWVRPSAKNFRPPVSVVDTKNIKDLKEFLPSEKKINSFRLVDLDGRTCYQLAEGFETSYFDAQTGKEIKEADEVFASSLAHYYKGQLAPIVKTELVTSFDYKYPFINRLLPVVKVSFEDGEDYYIHTRSSRLGTVGNSLKDNMSLFFKLFHNLSFFDFSPLLKFCIVALSMLIIGFVTTTGLLLFLKTWKKKRKGLRQWHRYLGFFASVFIYCLAFSGLFHISVKTLALQYMKRAKPVEMDLSSFSKSIPEILKAKENLVSISSAMLNGEPFLRIVQIGQDKHPKIDYESISQNETIDEVTAAKTLASVYSGRSIEDIDKFELLTRFAGEYGFVNKRLPVWKATFKGSSERVYIETFSQKLALKVTPLKSAEGFSFAYLHKAHFLDFLGRNGRNITLMLLCVII
ncbi:MAG: PepSY domain-containing protein, partial [Lentisphaeraceae bacterium]|nr:PepSY domain-containing protein [Lentisphaeraceae bacterium]